MVCITLSSDQLHKMQCFLLLLMALLCVHGQNNVPGKPDAVHISAKSASCVTLSWQKPKGQTEGITGYEYKCTGNSSWAATNNGSHTKVVCGYKPYMEVSCTMRTVSNVFSTSDEVQTKKVYTECAAPAPPRNIQVSKSDKYEYSGGFKTWHFNVSWEPPAAINCRSLSSYPARYQVGRKSSVDMYRNYALFSLNAGENVTFSVRVRNNLGSLSKKAQIEIYAPPAAPSKPNSFVLESNDTDCVTLSWGQPTFSNGKITNYEHKCNDKLTWTSTGESKTARVCGYAPNTAVRCSLRAINGATNPGEATNLMYTRTACDAPDKPVDVKLSYATKPVSEANGKWVWNCTATWQKPKSIKCGSLHATEPYRYRVNKGAETNTKTNVASFLVSAGTPIRFSVKAKNAGSLSSDEAIVEQMAPQGGPSKPTSLSLLTQSVECITLNWKKPLYDNGHITEYQYKCTGEMNWSKTDNSDSHQIRICGYQPSSRVSCSVRAMNGATAGDTATTGIVYTFSRAWSPPTSTPKQQRYTRNPTNKPGRPTVTTSPALPNTTSADLSNPCPGDYYRCPGTAYCVFKDKYRCVCKEGFSGDGKQCTDIDECEADRHYCDSNAKCINTVGSFQCQCAQGFIGNGLTCQDIDECAGKTDNCDSNAVCINTPGSFMCKCKASYSGNGVKCEAGLPCPDDSLTCSIHGLCGFNSVLSKYYCSCKEGLTGNGKSCIDVDECKENIHNCDKNAACTNTIGSFRCACNEHHSGDGITCTDERTPCPESSMMCSTNAHCVFDGTHKCLCKTGFAGDGITCNDVDECQAGKDNCNENAFCTNSIGSFRCTCKMNFAGNGVNCI